MTWEPGMVYLRHIGKDGTGYLEAHQCWNRTMFIQSTDQAARKAGTTIELATEEQYRQSKARTK